MSIQEIWMDGPDVLIKTIKSMKVIDPSTNIWFASRTNSGTPIVICKKKSDVALAFA
jgi:hypothetical protein